MITIELTPQEACFIFDRIVREKVRATGMQLKADALNAMHKSAETKEIVEAMNKVQDKLNTLADKFQTGLDKYFDEHPDEKTEPEKDEAE